MGGFVSCMPEDDDIRTHHVTAGESAITQNQRRPSARPSMQATPHQHQHQFNVTQTTQQQDQTHTRVLRERLSANLLDSYTTNQGATSIDYHANARICMERTPNAKEKQNFKFYCPICMMHFREIYKSACCNGYVCVPCALAHITQRLILPHPLIRIPVGPIQSVCCPSCNTENVSLLPVILDTARGERPRNYAESPQTREILAGVETRKASQLGVATNVEGGEDKENAPVSRAGSFQTLHRKILNFEAASEQEDALQEQSVSRSAAALPPRTGPTRTSSATTITITPPSPTQPITNATLPSITPFQSNGNPLAIDPLESIDDVPSFLPPLPDELTDIDHDRTIRVVPAAVTVN